ncbi:MAG: NUDIX hydrolase [Deltaproteobacteria bacterium CG03_land_8_20_14_0_80_45_14]|nr:MAG: NUDIX hydrolase [Deltaproteobacteria bacterium CG03_land_8_20_14_0_80_45_14]
MIKPWPCIRSGPSQSFRVFSVRTDTTLSPRTGREHNFYVIESRDWINVIPLTDDHQVVMIRQYRHGSREVTLEIPGGLVDPGDTPEKAAARELLEETGFQAKEWTKIGVVNPNPALFNNRCYTFLAQDIKKVAAPTPDQTEDIEVALIPLTDIPKLILKGEIDHAMVITAFSYYFLRHPKELTNP